MLKSYDIPVIWQSMQTFTVEAETLQDAVKQALEQFMKIPDDNYLTDSFDVDTIVEENYPDEKYDVDKALE